MLAQFRARDRTFFLGSEGGQTLRHDALHYAMRGHANIYHLQTKFRKSDQF